MSGVAFFLVGDLFVLLLVFLLSVADCSAKQMLANPVLMVLTTQAVSQERRRELGGTGSVILIVHCQR